MSDYECCAEVCGLCDCDQPCNVLPLLKALPDASEEQIEAATLILDFVVRPTVYRDGKIEFLTYKPQVRREVTEREIGRNDGL